jgi:hypothetical protein
MQRASQACSVPADTGSTSFAVIDEARGRSAASGAFAGETPPEISLAEMALAPR